MESSSVSQEDHEVEHDFAIQNWHRRAKVRSARANRTVNSYVTQPSRGDDGDGDDGIFRNDPSSAVVLVEQNDASPKPVCRGISKDKRLVGRGCHAPGKSNKGARDRRKLREKRRSTGVMHVPSTESTGGSTGEDENNENSPIPLAGSKPPVTGLDLEEKPTISSKPGQSESDLDADDEANNSGDVRISEGDAGEGLLKNENERLIRLLETKDKRISALEMQVAQLTIQISKVREENGKLRAFSST